ncbi:MAG TPA: GNAT family N-acetyltransferase [Stellaceae bacterium]|nr:GNAT family N-acetyltransferase [Stellaceae bacterium]
MAQPADLAWRVEEACLNGWPALRQVWLDGWLLRFSQGHTRRSNSVTPVAPSRRDLRDKIAYCEALYAWAGLPPIFRVPTIAETGVDATLAACGYAAEDETCVIYRDLDGSLPERGEAELSEGMPSTAWLDAHAHFTGSAASGHGVQRKILAALAVPAVFAATRTAGGRIASVAFGAVHDRILCLNLVATHPASRRSGLSRRTVSAVLAWAQAAGAAAACLPVVASNTPAVALYRTLGFDAELYRYHYRRRREPRPQR